MPAFFSEQRGTVVRIAGPGGSPVLPFSVRMQGLNIGAAVNAGTSAIITQAAVVENGNYQIQHMLDSSIFTYVFGDRIGELRVSGLAFSKLCQGSGGPGLNQVISNYQANRIANGGAPVLINYGTSLYRGLLVGMTNEISDPENNIGQWGLRFASVPANTSQTGAGSGGNSGPLSVDLTDISGDADSAGSFGGNAIAAPAAANPNFGGNPPV